MSGTENKSTPSVSFGTKICAIFGPIFFILTLTKRSDLFSNCRADGESYDSCAGLVTFTVFLGILGLIAGIFAIAAWLRAAKKKP